MPLHPKASAIAKTVEYEVKMLIATASAINNGHLRGGAIENALLEAFLIHTRVLSDFFFLDPKRSDDVSAKHFFNNEDTWHPNRKEECPYIEENYERINKALTHLSYSRLNYAENKSWSHNVICSELMGVWGKFKQALPAESTVFFQKSGSFV